MEGEPPKHLVFVVHGIGESLVSLFSRWRWRWSVASFALFFFCLAGMAVFVG